MIFPISSTQRARTLSRPLWNKHRAINVAVCISIGLTIAISTHSYAQDKPWQGIGRAATKAEVKAWDIDVRGDFKGLPEGKGTVAKGEVIWENKCVSCHGIFGESNEVFTPLVGGTSAEDIKNGRVAALSDGSVPHRSTMMKVAKLSTMWDYIHRAMPWDAPKSLSHDEVYSVLAYILNLSGVVPGEFELSDKNIVATQMKLPNRHGLKEFPGLWETKGKGDVVNLACMTDCAKDVQISSFLPEFARNAHGNLFDQHRLIGPVRGADTSKPAPASLAMLTSSKNATKERAPDTEKASAGVGGKAALAPMLDVKKLLSANNCSACHSQKNKLVGPAFKTIAEKYQLQPEREAYFMKKISPGSSNLWGGIAMPAQTQVSEKDLKSLALWLANGAQ
jgi:cytochrome c551/c552